MNSNAWTTRLLIMVMLSGSILAAQTQNAKREDIPYPNPPYKLIKTVIPLYPKLALKMGLEGKVIVEVETTIYGRVVTVLKATGHSCLKKAALTAIKKWVVEPYFIGSVPRPVRFKVIFHFKIRP